MSTRYLACAIVLSGLASGVAAQPYIGPDESAFRGVYYPGTEYSTDEIYIFPLAATDGALAFASCPFVELPDSGGDEGTACRIEWLEAKGDAFLPVRSKDISGCSIADYWNIDCPDFTAEGMTHGNSEKLLASLLKSYPTPANLFETRKRVTTEILPHVTTGQPEGTFSEYAKSRLQYDFGMYDDCNAYAPDPAYADACTRAMAALPPEAGPIGVTAMNIGTRAIVCVIAADWSIPACAHAVPKP
ncbi:MAG: hypothetical protein Q4G25_06405 [Paracoccus sp. (in: a-proteobacteria)]|nr:hypothetical protein [Paracoccus sp. (in: a-proteobacteria)]